MRIVSLTPSATEIVCSLALRSRLVGVSHECDAPASVRRLPSVTAPWVDGDAQTPTVGTWARAGRGEQVRYALRMDVLERVRPDIIVLQGLGDGSAADGEVEAALRGLASRPRVINLPPTSLEDVLETIARVGTAAGKPYQARRVVTRLRRRIAAVRARTDAAPMAERPRVAVLEWLHPPCAAGLWMPELVGFAGGISCLGEAFAPASPVDWRDVAACSADVIFLALGGQDAERKEALALLAGSPAWRALPAMRAGRVCVIDDAACFNRPGPRLVDGLEWLAHILHPRIHPSAAGPTPIWLDDGGAATTA